MALFGLIGGSWDRRFSDLVQDLHTLEVNTIEKSGMTARRMPPVPTAIAEIADFYRAWLSEAYGAEGEAWAQSDSIDEDTRAAIAVVYEKLQQSTNQPNRPNEFDYMAEFARQIEQHGYFGVAGDDRIICQRIWRNAAYLYSLIVEADNPTGGQAKRPIKTVKYKDWTDTQQNGNITPLKSAKPTEISLYNLAWIRDEVLERAWDVAFEDRAKIWKIWEVGTETVLVQTAIQLEGDVVTRISRRVSSSDSGGIMKVHQQGIETSIAMWSKIIDAVARFVEVLGKKFK